MKRVFFLFPIIGAIFFIARGWRCSDLDNTPENIVLLGLINGAAFAGILAAIILL